MPTVTIDVPTERYADFLRLAADFLEGVSKTPDTPSSSPEPQGLGWDVTTTHPGGDDDFDLLVDYYRRLSPTAKRILDYLVDHPQGAEPDAMSFVLGFETKYALSGSVGHATKLAGELGRPCPIQHDKQRDRYWVSSDLIDAVRQARLWSLPEPYLHTFEGPFGEDVSKSHARPYRYAMWPNDEADPEVGYFADRDELLSTEPEAFDEALFAVVEFAPDHFAGTLADRTTIAAGAEHPRAGGE